jgi:hypothetical protein
MIGRGGGDRNDKCSNKACALNALQPSSPANQNKWNKMADLLVSNYRFGYLLLHIQFGRLRKAVSSESGGTIEIDPSA